MDTSRSALQALVVARAGIDELKNEEGFLIEPIKYANLSGNRYAVHTQIRYFKNPGMGKHFEKGYGVGDIGGESLGNKLAPCVIEVVEDLHEPGTSFPGPSCTECHPLRRFNTSSVVERLRGSMEDA
jgi:hypothetical protein